MLTCMYGNCVGDGPTSLIVKKIYIYCLLLQQETDHIEIQNDRSLLSLKLRPVFLESFCENPNCLFIVEC